jgi:regulatory protein
LADEIIGEVLDRYSEVGMIDDEAFAKAWVTSRHHSRGLAGRALAGELRRKGVPPEAVGAAVDDLDPATEQATARALVARRLRTERATSRSPRSAHGRGGDGPDREPHDQEEAAREERQREHAMLARRLIGMLARKGYPAALAYRVVREALSGDASLTDTEALVDLDQTDEDFDEFDQVRS